MIHVICGAPCAGKSTYVKQRAKAGELVIDADELARTIGAGVDHRAKGACWNAALQARETLISYAKRSSVNSWIIHSAPSREQMREYRASGAEIVVLDPGIAECKRRAADRPRGTVTAIEQWYAKSVNELADPRERFETWAKDQQLFGDGT